jgi:hypothetical protein
MASRGVWHDCGTARVAALLALVFLYPTTVAAAGVVGSGTPQSCTEAALDAALAGGGLVTFKCGTGKLTITVTSTKAIAQDTTIDGRSLITLSGGNAVQVFHVSEGAMFSVQNFTVANGSADSGGAIAVPHGTLNVSNCTFVANWARSCGLGGAIAVGSGSSRSTLYVTNSAFLRNWAEGSTGPAQCVGFGGGIFAANSDVVVNKSVFTDNSAEMGGGAGGGIAIAFDTTAVTVSNTTFTGNRAEDAGSGIAVAGGTLTLTNSTFADNSGRDIQNGLFDGELGTVTVNNTIIAGNCLGPIIDGGHNLQWPGTSCGETIPSLDPVLDPAGLKDNGGPTQTIALLAGSPAIDGGDPEVCANPPVNGLDQRGYMRPGTGYASCSIGAFEYNSSGPPPATPSPPPTPTASLTAAPTVTQTPTLSASATPTLTLTPSLSATPTATRTATASATPSASVTATATARPSGGGGGGCTLTPNGNGAAWPLFVPTLVLAWRQRRKRDGAFPGTIRRSGCQ